MLDRTVDAFYPLTRNRNRRQFNAALFSVFTCSVFCHAHDFSIVKNLLVNVNCSQRFTIEHEKWGYGGFRFGFVNPVHRAGHKGLPLPRIVHHLR